MKKKFIDAYVWAYGGSKKKAAKIYKKAPEIFVRAVVRNFEDNAKKAFFYD